MLPHNSRQVCRIHNVHLAVTSNAKCRFAGPIHLKAACALADKLIAAFARPEAGKAHTVNVRRTAKMVLGVKSTSSKMLDPSALHTEYFKVYI